MQVFRFANQNRVLGNGASRLIHVPQQASPLFPVRTINQCDLGHRFGKQIFGACSITCKPVGERERLALVPLEKTHVVFAVTIARQQLHEGDGPLFVTVSPTFEQHDVIDVDRFFRVDAPDVVEKIIADGCADMVSMARPLLADAEFVIKAAANRADGINTCIGCNQAYLDHVFQQKRASCLVNPRACHETELVYRPAVAKKRIAVVGAGRAGLACATLLAERGHSVDLFDAASEIGGQFNMAKQIPGKEEFFETLRYFKRRIEVTGVSLHLNQQVSAEMLGAGKYDEVILATGVKPRDPKIPGQDMPHVLSYIDVLRDKKPVGKRVAVVGAGGIGFDVSEYLVDEGHSPALDNALWMKEWGVVDPSTARGGVSKPEVSAPARTVTLLQRKATTVGKGLGKTTGWIHRAALKKKRVEMISGANYIGIDARGLHITYGEKHQNPTLIEADTIVLCTGQEPLRALQAPLEASGVKVHLVGGAFEAGELDAKRAIDQASRLAATL